VSNTISEKKKFSAIASSDIEYQEGWIGQMTREMVEGSAIPPALVNLNTQFVADDLRWNINDRLGQAVRRFTNADAEGHWNRPHNYEAAVFFVGEDGQDFNAKVLNPKAEFKPTQGFSNTDWVATGKLRRYESITSGGNRIFYPALDLETRQLINQLWDVNLPLEGPVWPWLLEHPEIPIGITEGAKKALSLCGQGFICVAVLGIANWSIPRPKHPETGLPDTTTARVILPELAALAKGDRLVPVWYDMDEASKFKAIIAGQREARLLIEQLKAAGANKETTKMWWPQSLGKGIDDAIVHQLQAEISIPLWLQEVIANSKMASIYHQILNLYRLDPNRPIASRTQGGYFANHLELRLETGKIHALIAGTGSGKTTLIRKSVQSWIASGGFVLVITPTNKLGKQTAENFGLPHRHDYHSTQHLALKAELDGGMICCPDSLILVLNDIPRDRPLLVVIDEVDQVTNHCTIGTTLKGKYALTHEALANLLTLASAVVVAEARIPENTLKFLEALSGKSSLVYIHDLTENRRIASIYHGPISGFEARIIARLRAGEKLAIVCDSQRQLEALDRLIRELLPSLKGMRNDQQTSYLPDVQELTRNPNEVLARLQLDFLLYSPACKSGWSLDGIDTQGNTYGFDRVVAIFRVLPTSDQIQMLARYRPPCPWDIFIPECIQVAGDEAKSSPFALQRARRQEVHRLTAAWDIDYDPTDRPPLEQAIQDHYNVARVRSGLEKRIARYSLEQRLIADGHEVISLELERDAATGKRIKYLKDQIDRDWANLIAGTVLDPTDTSERAKMLRQLESPTPEQRAKAEKILLSYDFPGVDFDLPEICYQATRRYRALTKGVDREVAARNLELATQMERQQTLEHFQQPIIALHHLPNRAKQATLLKVSGLLDLLDRQDEVWTSESPEIQALKAKMLTYADDWERYWGFHFKADQSAISFLTRPAKRLGFEFKHRRLGRDGDRSYSYQLYTSDLVSEELLSMQRALAALEVQEQSIVFPAAPELLSLRQDDELDARSKQAEHLAKDLAVVKARIAALEDIASRIVVRQLLFQSLLHKPVLMPEPSPQLPSTEEDKFIPRRFSSS
jgi:Domain of unknown function (DUF3854)/AAA domain